MIDSSSAAKCSLAVAFEPRLTVQVLSWTAFQVTGHTFEQPVGSVLHHAAVGLERGLGLCLVEAKRREACKAKR